MRSKKLWAILVLCGAAVALGKSPHEKARIQHRPRPVTLEEDDIAQVFTAPGYETLIRLPRGEDIKQFGIGDGKRWVVECGVSAVADAGAPNLCHVKPGFADQSTNLNVITASGTFTFDLVPASNEHPVDLKVFVSRASDRDRLIASTAGFAPSADLVPRGELVACSTEAQRNRDQLLRSEQDLSEAGRRMAALVDPATVTFDYRYRGSKAGKVVLFHDATRTFLRTSGEPMIYASLEGKRKPVESACGAGLCVVHEVIDKGSFLTAVGGKEIKFERRKASHE